MKKNRKRKTPAMTPKDILAQGRTLLSKFSAPYPPGRKESLTAPILIKTAHRAIVSTYDRRELLDFDLGRGALIAGHGPRNVMLAVKKTAERRLFSAPVLPSEVYVARLISERIPSCESLYFFRDHHQTVAETLKAVALLKGRSMILTVAGCSSLDPVGDDSFEEDTRKKDCWKGRGRWAGITCLRLGLKDLDRMAAVFEEFSEQIAAVFIEPVGTHAGIQLLDSDVLQLLRELTRRQDAVLIYDEIHTAFHTRQASVQNETGLSPDLTCLGSLIGGGFPLGALGGSKDIMRDCTAYFSPAEPAAVVMQASLAVLRMLNDDFYAGLSKKADMLESRLSERLNSQAQPYALARYGPLLSVYKKGNTASGTCLSVRDYALMREHLLRANILLPQRATDPFAVSVTHTKKQLHYLMDNMLHFIARLDKND